MKNDFSRSIILFLVKADNNDDNVNDDGDHDNDYDDDDDDDDDNDDDPSLERHFLGEQNNRPEKQLRHFCSKAQKLRRQLR